MNKETALAMREGFPDVPSFPTEIKKAAHFLADYFITRQLDALFRKLWPVNSYTEIKTFFDFGPKIEFAGLANPATPNIDRLEPVKKICELGGSTISGTYFFQENIIFLFFGPLLTYHQKQL